MTNSKHVTNQEEFKKLTDIQKEMQSTELLKSLKEEAVKSFFNKNENDEYQPFLHQILVTAKTLLGVEEFVKFLENSLVSAGTSFRSK